MPSDRARTWRFTQGYLKKTGEPSKVVNKAMTQARCSSGVVGIKVSILPPDAEIHDKIVVDDEMKKRIMESCFEEPEVKEVAKKKSAKKGAKK